MMQGKIVQFNRDKNGNLYLLDDQGELWYGTHFVSSGSEPVVMNPVDLRFYRPQTEAMRKESRDIPF